MTRKIVLLVGTFLAAFMLFWAWRLVAPHSGPGGEWLGPARINTARAKQAMVLERRDNRGKLIQRLEVPRWEKNDKTGAYDCQDPAGVVYGNGTQRVYVRADKGTIYAEGVSGEIRHATFWGNVKVFFDNYKRDSDPSPSKRPQYLGATIGAVIECLEENPYGVVRAYLDDMDIDNERLLMQTASEVTVLSDRADLFGKGLEITWSQSPQELTGLKIVHGIRADLYDMGREGVFGLPGGRQEKAGAEGSDVAATQPAGGESIEQAAAAATRPAKAPATKPGKKRGKGEQIVRPRQNVYEVTFEGQDKDIRVVSGKQSLEGAKKLALQLEFTGGMRDSGAPRTPASRPAAASKPAAPGAPGETVASAKAPRKAASRPTTGPAGEKKPVTIEWDGALTLVPLARVEKPSEKRFKVEGSGPKVVLRDGESSAMCRKFSYHNDEEVAELNGAPDDPARLDIGNGQVVVCEQIIFRRKIGLAILPKAGYMARIRRPEVSKAQAALDRAELLEATGLSDPVEIKHLADSVVLPSDESADKPTVEDKITWGGSVLIEFKRMEQADPTKRAVLEGKRFKEFIDKAHFKRDVQLVQGKYGDWMHCDDLVVEMGLSSKGNPQPLRSIAKALEPGARVTAWQHGGGRRGATSRPGDLADKDAPLRGTKIEADEIDVTFRERPKAATTRPADPRMDFGGRTEPETMVAIGRVIVTDTARRDAKDTVRAFADRIESNVPLKSAILYGGNTRETFAKLTRGDNDANLLAGAQIQVEDFDQRAIVKGPGFVTFLTDKDFNGRKVAAPRPVTVTWTEGMTYLPVGPEAPRPLPEDPKALAALKLSRSRLVREAVFTGSAVMNAGDDTMTCHKMTVELDPPAEKPAKPATAPAPAVAALVASPFDPPSPAAAGAPPAPAPATPAAPAADRAMLTVEDFGSRKLFMVSGEGDVVLQSLRREDAGFILRRLEARADKLLYYAGSKTSGNARIEVPGHGWLFNEDYRMEDQGGSAEGPSQTHFEWHKSMVLVQNADGTASGGRTATLHGNVSMTHHSGRTIRVPKELMVRHSADKLPQGRITNLDCEDMIAEFEGAADKKSATRPAVTPAAVTPTDNKPADGPSDAMNGPAIGRLSLFAATGADADAAKGQRDVPVQMTDGAVSIMGKRLLYNRQEHTDQVATVYGYLLGKPDVNARVVIENPMEATVRTWESPKITILFDQTGKRIQQVKVEGGVGNQ